MVMFKNFYRLSSNLFALPLALTMVSFPAKAQINNFSSLQAQNNNPQEDLSDPNNLRPLNQSDSLLSLQGGQKLMSEATKAIDSQKYQVAATKLQQSRQIFNQLSNFYLQLFNSFSGVDNRIAEAQKRKALQTGQMRDEATYKLALVHRAQNQPELSVPLLIQVIRSQNPTSELGKKCYQQLVEIGFVEAPVNTSNSGKK